MGLLHQVSVVPYSFLPQAGDGGEYLEGYKDPYHVCFKCGKPGHWAQNCTGFLPDGQVSPVLFDFTHLLPFRLSLRVPMRFPVPFLLPLSSPFPSFSPSTSPFASPVFPFPLPLLLLAFLFVSQFSSRCAILLVRTWTSVTQSKTQHAAYACRQSQMAAAVMLRQHPWPPGQPLPATPPSAATYTCPKAWPLLSRPHWQRLQMMYWQAV